MSADPSHSLCASVLLTAALLLAASAPSAQPGTVLSEQKISETAGGFGGDLDLDDAFGWSVAGLGDLDGNGVVDLAVGVPGDDDGFPDNGALWILLLNADGSVASEQKISSTEGNFGGFIEREDSFGSALAPLGDLDGDGVGDLAASVLGPFLQGAVWILFLNPDGTVAAQQKIGESLGGFGGELDTGVRFGNALASLGDLNGDGVGDLAVGTHLDNDGGLDQGAVWILFLRTDGTVASEQKISATEGGFGGELDPGDRFGTSLAALGDLDGDGLGELAVGAMRDDDGGTDQGAVWILSLNADGTVASETKISETAGGFGGVLDPSDEFGSSVALLGDLDCDGIEDLAVGAAFDDDGGFNQGAVWILFLAPDGSVSSLQKISATGGGFMGALQTRSFGRSLGSPGDLDGDGIGELAAGAHLDGDGGQFGAPQGAVWILFLEGSLRLDFEDEDDFETALVNGQDLSTPPELGSLVALTSSGPNAGAAIFDSTPLGPNDPGQDLDLLVGSGNILILQGDANPTQTLPGVFDRPNDDSDGGVLAFTFTSPVEPRGLDLIDIDSRAAESTTVVQTDVLGRIRVHAIPPGWTGDLVVDGAGRRTLDLTTLAPQPGFASTATALEDPGFRRDRVIALEVRLGGSGAIDELCWRPLAPAASRGPRARPMSGAGLPTGTRSR